ncbi:MAG: hypothetical protein HOO06_00105 [Bdellovibrionaceae bacterium]|nr:hypothetical protein [Pseudobdellovibrionaceae bacterium]
MKYLRQIILIFMVTLVPLIGMSEEFKILYPGEESHSGERCMSKWGGTLDGELLVLPKRGWVNISEIGCSESLDEVVIFLLKLAENELVDQLQIIKEIQRYPDYSILMPGVPDVNGATCGENFGITINNKLIFLGTPMDENSYANGSCYYSPLYALSKINRFSGYRALLIKQYQINFVKEGDSIE